MSVSVSVMGDIYTIISIINLSFTLKICITFPYLLFLLQRKIMLMIILIVLALVLVLVGIYL